MIKSYYIPAVKHPQVLTALETHRQLRPGIRGSQTFGLSWGLLEVQRETDLYCLMKSVVPQRESQVSKEVQTEEN